MPNKKKTAGKYPLNQRNWLNIIIFTISALFLIFILLGKVLNQSTQTITTIQESQVQAELMQIDFGYMQITLHDSEWSSSVEGISKKQIDDVVSHWKALLKRPTKTRGSTPLVAETILLFFSNQAQPVIVKVSRPDNKTMITFVGTQIQFDFTKNDYKHFVPQINRAMPTIKQSARELN